MSVSAKITVGIFLFAAAYMIACIITDVMRAVVGWQKEVVVSPAECSCQSKT